jgi:Large polyvalent protein-associated domain 7
MPDSGVVTDEAQHVRVNTPSEGAAILALNLASDRFGPRPLVVRGTDEFQHGLAQAAGAKELRVTFADPALEARRYGGYQVDRDRPTRSTIGGVSAHQGAYARIRHVRRGLGYSILTYSAVREEVSPSRSLDQPDQESSGFYLDCCDAQELRAACGDLDTLYQDSLIRTRVPNRAVRWT